MFLTKPSFHDACQRGPGSLEALLNEHAASREKPAIKMLKRSVDRAAKAVFGPHATVQGAGSVYKGVAIASTSDLDLLVRLTSAVEPPTKVQRKRMAEQIAASLANEGAVYEVRLGERVIHLVPPAPAGALPAMDVVLEHFKCQAARMPPDPHHLDRLSRSHGARMALRALRVMQHIYHLPPLPSHQAEAAALAVADACPPRAGLAEVLPRLLRAMATRQAPPLPVSQAWGGAASSMLHVLQKHPKWVLG